MDQSENVPRPGPPKPMTPEASPTADRPPTPADAQAGTPGGEPGGQAPETGDIVVDAELRDLAAVDEVDLDATLAAGESVHRTLTARLSDLGT